MKKYNFQETYPVFVKEYSKNEMRTKTLDDICQYFYEKIEEHPVARHLHTFDHHAHTADIEGGIINDTIIGAKNVLFCFGKNLMDPKLLSVRPRSIGICETESHFVISFLEAPNPAMTQAMVEWVNDLRV